MAKKDKNEKAEEIKDVPEEEKVTVRHTITAEETFTLAKDVFDIRCFLKNVYANRAVIARRLNILSLSVSGLFTLLYCAYMVFGGIIGKLEMGATIAVYTLFGVYFALMVAIIIVTATSHGASTKSVRKISKLLSFFRLAVRILSLGITVTAIAFSVSGGEYAAPNLAVDVLILTFSILVLIFQIIPLFFGGMGKLVRWLLSPVKVKYRFSAVVLEWYELAAKGNPVAGSQKKVSSKYIDDIGRVIDRNLRPALGKKYINSIKAAAILNVIERSADEEKAVVEGVLKSVFAYAADCSYVTFNPCKDLSLEGSVEEEVKEKKTLKDRFMGLGKKIGKSMLDKYISSATTTDDES